MYYLDGGTCLLDWFQILTKEEIELEEEEERMRAEEANRRRVDREALEEEAKRRGSGVSTQFKKWGSGRGYDAEDYS